MILKTSILAFGQLVFFGPLVRFVARGVYPGFVIQVHARGMRIVVPVDTVDLTAEAMALAPVEKISCRQELALL
jgi:hypothetical protein